MLEQGCRVRGETPLRKPTGSLKTLLQCSNCFGLPMLPK